MQKVVEVKKEIAPIVKEWVKKKNTSFKSQNIKE